MPTVSSKMPTAGTVLENGISPSGAISSRPPNTSTALLKRCMAASGEARPCGLQPAVQLAHDAHALVQHGFELVGVQALVQDALRQPRQAVQNSANDSSTMAAPNTVDTPGIDTGIKNGRQAMAQTMSMPSRPQRSSNSRKVMVSPWISSMMEVSNWLSMGFLVVARPSRPRCSK